MKLENYRPKLRLPGEYHQYTPTLFLGPLGDREKVELLSALEDIEKRAWEIKELAGIEFIAIPEKTVRDIWKDYPEYRGLLGILNPDIGLPQPIAFFEDLTDTDAIRLKFGATFDVPELMKDSYFLSRCLMCPWTADVTVHLDKDYICQGEWNMTYDSRDFGRGEWEARGYPWFENYALSISGECGIMIWRELWRLGFIPRTEWENVKSEISRIMIYDEENF